MFFIRFDGRNYSRFNSHPLGKVKYKKDYKKSKVPLFRYMDKKTTTNEMLSQRQPSGYTSGLANGDRDGNGSNGNKPGKDSMKMINDIVKDIVKKYKTRFNPAKSGRDEVDSNLCICQFQDSKCHIRGAIIRTQDFNQSPQKLTIDPQFSGMFCKTSRFL